jgi:hypothetical protein
MVQGETGIWIKWQLFDCLPQLPVFCEARFLRWFLASISLAEVLDMV